MSNIDWSKYTPPIYDDLIKEVKELDEHWEEYLTKVVKATEERLGEEEYKRQFLCNYEPDPLKEGDAERSEE